MRAPCAALYRVLRPIHLALAVLVPGHAAAALLHQRQGRAVLCRMWRG
ncbi:hypothetical protein [Elioraea thermophila]|nr:hypothetical protein [Elioraea thermophila]